MKEFVIISGKGGTGKTTLTASFIALEQNQIIVDCDVDASDLHLILKPEIKIKEKFIAGKTAVIDEKLCIKCGKCIECCRFNAIKDFKVYDIFCEGCSFCYHVCPVNAINMKDKFSAFWFYSNTRYGKMFHASLKPGEENSGKLISLIREQARNKALKDEKDLIIIDGPPGTSCPVISSITGVNLVLVVIEPTCSSLHDFKRVYELVCLFKIKILVCINKWDISKELTKNIEEYCLSNNIEIVGKIPFDKSIIKSLLNGKTVVEEYNNELTQTIKDMWIKIKKYLNNKGGKG